MIKYVFLFFPQPKQAPNQTDTQCVHQKKTTDYVDFYRCCCNNFFSLRVAPQSILKTHRGHHVPVTLQWAGTLALSFAAFRVGLRQGFFCRSLEHTACLQFLWYFANAILHDHITLETVPSNNWLSLPTNTARDTRISRGRQLVVSTPPSTSHLWTADYDIALLR